MSPCTSLTFKLHRRRESVQTCMEPGVLLESRQILNALVEGDVWSDALAPEWAS